ncbi:MAG: cohesin domain-containing protein [bacterium]
MWKQGEKWVVVLSLGIVLSLFWVIGIRNTAQAKWIDWVSLGGEMQGDPVAISLWENHVTVFAVGMDNALWCKTWMNDAWTDSESLGGQIAGTPAVVSWGQNHCSVFARGIDGALWVKTILDGSWRDWVSLGGEMQGDPVAISLWENHISVCARAMDNSLWCRVWQNDVLSNWEPLGGKILGSPSAISLWENHITVFARAVDNALWCRTWLNDVLSDWEPLGGEIQGTPRVVSWGPDHASVVARGMDNAVWIKTWVADVPCLQDDSGNLDIEEHEGRIGDEIVIPVRIQSAPDNVATLGFEVTYDANVLEYIDFYFEENNLATSLQFFDVNKIGDSARLIIGGYTDEAGIIKDESGILVNLRFRVIGGEKGCCYPLQLENLKDNIARFTKTDGSFTIIECNGDMNEDGAITPEDARIVFECYLQKGPYTDCCDVNRDGEVTPADALCVFQKYLGKDSCLD